MGRQQVKIWRRRAAKKMKQLAIRAGVDPLRFDGQVNATEGWVPDWVCVTFGVNSGQEQVVRQGSGENGWIGFEDRGGKINLAVHVLTEDKRKELDLEGYFEGDNEIADTFDRGQT
jgi:hypothetical protein